MVRLVGGPWGQPIWSQSLQCWAWVIEVAYPPFAVQLLLDGAPELLAGVDISDFTTLDPDTRYAFGFEPWMIGFGHTPHPLQYDPVGMLQRRGAS